MSDRYEPIQEFMTRRDQFATAILMGLVSNRDTYGSCDYRELAIMAFDLANHMVEAREESWLAEHEPSTSKMKCIADYKKLVEFVTCVAVHENEFAQEAEELLKEIEEGNRL